MPVRDSDDRCPGVLRPFAAADGAIVRLRAPGGRLRTRDLVAVCDLAAAYGQPFVQLTSRANLQLRGLAQPLPAEFVEAVTALGLLPSATHERVRNIVASPGTAVDALVRDLDAAIVTSPSLAGLSGRWIFALVGSNEPMPAVPADVMYVCDARDEGVGAGRLVVAGREMTCPASQAVAAMVGVAEAFVATTQGADGGTDAGTYWNVADLPQGHAFFDCLDDLDGSFPRAEGFHPVDDDVAADAERTGSFAGPENDSRTALVLHLPLGLLDARSARALAAVTDDVVVTPERSIVVRAHDRRLTDDDRRALDAAGFALDGGSATARFTACVGAPYCRRTDVATLDLTRAAADAYDAEHRAVSIAGTGDTAPRVHVVGCERACGRPNTPHRLVVAPTDLTAILEPNGSA